MFQRFWPLCCKITCFAMPINFLKVRDCQFRLYCFKNVLFHVFFPPQVYMSWICVCTNISIWFIENVCVGQFYHKWSEVWTRVTWLGLESDSSHEFDDFRLDLTKCKETCNSTWTFTSMTRDLTWTWAFWLDKTCYFPQNPKIKKNVNGTPCIFHAYASMCVCVLSAQHPIKLDPCCFDPTASIQSNCRTTKEDELSNKRAS